MEFIAFNDFILLKCAGRSLTQVQIVSVCSIRGNKKNQNIIYMAGVETALN